MFRYLPVLDRVSMSEEMGNLDNEGSDLDYKGLSKGDKLLKLLIVE